MSRMPGFCSWEHETEPKRESYPAQGHELRTLAVKGLPPKAGPFVWLQTILLLGKSLLQAVSLILRFRPHVIIGTGGYASAPVLLAAILMRSLGLWKGLLSLHEANIIPGRFNRWASGWVDFTGTSFPETLRFLSKKKAFWTGYPLRKDLESSSERRGQDSEEKRERLGVPPAGKGPARVRRKLRGPNDQPGRFRGPSQAPDTPGPLHLSCNRAPPG